MKALIKTGLICISALVVASCQPGAKKEAQVPAESESKVLPVKIEKIQGRSITRTLEYSANLTAFKEIHYAPASPGRIEKINVEVGDRVRKGLVLVEIDKTQLYSAQTQLESAKDSYQRIKTLYEQGSIAEQQYEQTKTQYELARQNVEFLLENTTLASPVNGIITGKYYENGELFSGAPNTQAGKAAVLSLMQINPLKAMVSISQSHYEDVKAGMKANVTTDVIKDEIFEGKITNVYPTIDPMTRTFKTEIIIENPQEKLRPGMSATIQLMLSESDAIVVPAISVLKQSGTNTRYVFVYEKGLARRIEVLPGKRFDDMVEIISPEIREGMELIVEGQARLIDGSEIEIKK